MSEYRLPVPSDQADQDALFAEGWTLEAPGDEPAYMRAPERLQRAYGFDRFVREIEEAAVARVFAGSLDSAWAEAVAAIPLDEDGIERFTLILERCGCGGAYAILRPGANGEDLDDPDIETHGFNEPEALRALAAKLREARG